MELVLVGINHKTAPIEIREKFAFSPKKTVEANRLLNESAFLAENLILSTCNRMEIYALTNAGGDCFSGIKTFLTSFHNIDISRYENKIYIRKNRKVVEHLFGLAAGLDSMVVGEVEIMGQVKRAYGDARGALATGKVLNRLFEKSFSAAKKIRTNTLVGRGTVSMSSAAVKLAGEVLGGLKDKTALVIGTGTVGEQIILYLKKNGIASILIANRTFGKARDLAAKFGIDALEFADFKQKIADADILITSSGAPHRIIHSDDIRFLMPGRRHRPFFIIDLAVPRNVEEGVSEIDNVYLYDVDDLGKIVNENMRFRKSELDKCHEIISVGADSFMKWLVNENMKGRLHASGYRVAVK